MATLAETLAYQNDEVVRKFASKLGLSLEESNDIFTETKKLLWYTAHSRSRTAAMHRSMQIIDEMWHTFILFTVDYAKFCEEYLGQFIHHIPTPDEEKQQAVDEILADPEKYKTELNVILRNELVEVSQLLGDDTIHTWHVTYREQFPPDRIKNLKVSAELGNPASTIHQDSSPLTSVRDLHGESLIDSVVGSYTDFNPGNIKCAGNCSGPGPICVCYKVS